MMEQGPVLVVSFTSQEISVVYDMSGRVVEGDPVCLSSLSVLFITFCTTTTP